MVQNLHYYSFILSPSEWTTSRGMVSAAKGHQTGLSACTATFHIGRQRLGYLHDETVLPWLSIKISNGEDLKGNLAAPIRG